MNETGFEYMMVTLERDRIIKTMFIGFGLGVAACMGVFSITKPDDTLQCIYILTLFGIALSGMPYMWMKLPKIYGILNPVNWVLVIIKFIISTSFGLVYTPISLIVKIVQAKIYHKRVREAYNQRSEDYPNDNSVEY